MDRHKANLEEKVKDYDPNSHSNVTGDPFKTLFVSHISYDCSERRLKKEFEQFGPIKRVKIVYDHDNKPRGYAFIEFENERDLKNAYKQADAAWDAPARRRRRSTRRGSARRPVRR